MESSDARLLFGDWEFDVHALILDTFDLSGEFGSFFYFDHLIGFLTFLRGWNKLDDSVSFAGNFDF